MNSWMSVNTSNSLSCVVLAATWVSIGMHLCELITAIEIIYPIVVHTNKMHISD